MGQDSEEAVKQVNVKRPHKRQRKSALFGTTKTRGEVSELAFALKATSMGFGVARPYGESKPYDCLVETPARVWRVQVKSTHTVHHTGFSLFARHSRGRAKVPYLPSEIDLIVGHVVPRDAWYVIPVAAIRSAAPVLRLYPDGATRSPGKFEQFREAWCLMACHREGPFNDLRIEPRCQDSGTCPMKWER